jgi:hypothetical protein
MNLLRKLEKSRSAWFLIIVSFFFFLLRLPSLFEPYWYGDEGIYETIGLAMRHGRLLYQGIWDNKPPLLYVLYALFNGEQPQVRFLSLIFGILAVIAFYFLAKQLFSTQQVTQKKITSEKIIFLATALFAFLFAIPLLEGNIANSENFMLLPILVSGLLVYTYPQNKKNILLIISGLLLSFAFLLKVVAVFDFAAFFLFLFFTLTPIHISLKNISNAFPIILKNLTQFTVSFFIPIVITVLYFIFNKALSDFIHAAFTQNVGYVGYGNKLLFAQGLLVTKLLVLGLFVLFLFIKRQLFSSSTIFIALWFSFSLFNAFFSGRPYTHYMLVLLPSFVLLATLLLMHFFSQQRNNTKKYYQIAVILFLLSTFLVVRNFNFYSKTTAYYKNFISFITKQKNLTEYQKFFDAHTPNDYLLAQFLSAKISSSDSVFIWGNNAQVYKLINKIPPGRFTVLYHMNANENTLEETENSIRETKPTIIVTYPQYPLPFTLSNYKESYTVADALIYERTY